MDDQAYSHLRERVIDALWTDVAQIAEEVERTGRIPHEQLWSVLRGMDVLGLLVPETYGGAGLTIAQYVPIIAEFAKVHGGIRALVHVHNSFAHAIGEHGTERQRRDLLPGVSSGAVSIAFALTEPDHGTGLDLGTTARYVDRSYRIDGRKWLITNSDFASHFIVLARTGESGADALSAILVEREAPGLTIEALPETMGCTGGQHGLLTFDGVHVSVDSVLGGVPGRGAEHLEQALEVSRLLVAASSLGVAEHALDLSLAHSKRRVTFGRAIAERQAIQRYLAEMAMDVYALRTMVKDAATKWDRGDRIAAEASLVKLFGLEAVGRVTDRALLIFGGIGYTRAHPIERLYRDARLNWLEEGPPTVQYLTAARELLRRHASASRSSTPSLALLG